MMDELSRSQPDYPPNVAPASSPMSPLPPLAGRDPADSHGFDVDGRVGGAERAPLTKPLARYQHARRVGPLLFIAGQGSRDPATNSYAGVSRDATGAVVAHDAGIQALAVLTNIERVLFSHGLTRRNLVDVTVFLTNMDEFGAMNQVWNEFFAAGDGPTRTTVAVTALPGDNFVEMKAIAAYNPSAEPEGGRHDAL